MGIFINITYQIVRPESAAEGDVAEYGKIDTGVEYTFRELVELLQVCEYSGNGWATHYDYNYDYTTGERESRDYHPQSARDERYFIKACKFAGILH